LAWSTLMKRTIGLDVLVCPKCTSRMELISAVEDGAVAANILRHLGLPARPPPRGRPWRPQRELALERQDADDAFDSVDPPAFAD
jgi:hypothetical protein